MTLKWCVLTGALMLAFVGATFKYKSVVANPPGVYTRWFDGTTQRVDKFYPDGKLKSTTVYGDDGKTVLILAEVTDAGALVHSKVRHEDGKVEEKTYSEDGKILLVQTIWVGDETYFLAKREFFPDGKLQSEVIMTEDGTVPTSRRVFDADGKLSLDVHVLSNADQEANEYQDGKLIHRQVFKANADTIDEFFFPGTEIVSRRMTKTTLTGEIKTELFNMDGTISFSSALLSKDGKVVRVLYNHGKMILRQTAVNFLLAEVEEFNPGSSTAKRKLEIDAAGNVTAVDLYRADGTLARVKHMNNSSVEGTDDYDASGTHVIRKQAGGEPEHIDQDLLRPITGPRQEE